MVHIINKSAGDSGGTPYSYAELAELYYGSCNGDPIATIRFDSLPKSEQSLGESIYKSAAKPKKVPTVSFKDGQPVVKKAKQKKPKVVDPFQPIPIPDIKVERRIVKSEKQLRNEILDADLNSSDPFIRERARQWKNGEI